MATDTTKDILATWETSSQYWTKHQSLIEEMFAPLTRALIEVAHIGQPRGFGQSVVDIGGGSGEPSLTIAQMMGASGSVTYTDPAAGMVKAAQEASQRRGLTNLQFRQCPAEQLPFPDNAFDVAVSRLAAMFFPDPLAGLLEILRVIRPGARVSLLVWGTRDANPFFNVMTEVLNRFVPVEEEDEDAPAAFRFARPGKLARIFEEAGATSVTERSLAFRIEAPITVEHFYELRTEMSDTFRTKLAKLSADQVRAVKETVEKAVAKYFEGGAMSFPAEALIVTGRKREGMKDEGLGMKQEV